ncbi:MAG TPA: hypothetical protein PLL76_18235 [Thermoanaerobaculia bacterium]|nr:hypothetical protein [Thermoanaerobaculia bacterium]
MKSIEPALSALNQIVSRCRDSSDEDFLLELKRLVALGRGSAALAGGIAECEAEFGSRIEAYFSEFRDTEALALQLRDELAASYGEELPSLNTSAATGTPEPMLRALSMESFSRLESEAKASGPSLDRLTEMARILSWQISCVQRGRLDPPPEVVALKKRLAFLEERREWLDRERENHIRVDAGACWHELQKWEGKLNPSPTLRDGPLDFEAILDQALESLASPPIEKVLYGGRTSSSARRASDEELRRFRDWRASFQLRLERFRDDLHYRLQTAVSRNSLLRRYAARCMWFRRDELSEKIRRARQAGRSDLERLLADDAAAYLFDCGLFVLTEVNVRPVRLDLIADAGSELLLVEAKVYGKERGGLEATTQGLRQLLDYATDLRSSGLNPASYLLLFRSGGRKVACPAGPFEIQGTVVEIVHIDLATSAEKGSRAGPPEACTVEELSLRVQRPAKQAGRALDSGRKDSSATRRRASGRSPSTRRRSSRLS